MAERAWIRGAQQGSVADLERLFREHWPRAFRAARLVTGDAAAAEDIAQEAFLAAVRNLDRFDRRRPFAPVAAPDRRQPRDRLDARAQAPRPRSSSATTSRRRPRPSSTATRSPGSPTSPPEHRAVVVLRYVLEYTPGEIAELLDLPRGTVNSRLRRGLDRMKEET